MAFIGYSFEQLFGAQGNIGACLADPTPMICGAIAGGVGRALVLPIDMGGAKGPIQTVVRRVPQYALLFGLYVPTCAALNKKVADPEKKAATTLMCGALAGYYMRLWTNPINRTFHEASRMGVSPLDAAKAMKAKTLLQFWYTGHPLIANAIYFGSLMMCFEGTRRFLERNGAPAGTPVGNALTNGTAGAVGALVASTVTYPVSATRYAKTVIHDSAICRGMLPTLAKEVPMSFIVFGTYSLLQSAIASHHSARGGFGYSKN
eukprot:GILI01022544.1.p1 GENE.GILI01022544.1~~GILI01022544.1.p1  ORF type:complete len:262 (+),score=41.22 GILI01022544.1:29-814(+)